MQDQVCFFNRIAKLLTFGGKGKPILNFGVGVDSPPKSRRSTLFKMSSLVRSAPLAFHIMNMNMLTSQN